MAKLIEQNRIENKRLEKQWEESYRDSIHIEGKRDLVIIPMAYVREKRKQIKLKRKIIKWSLWLFWFIFSTATFYQLMSRFL